MIPYDVPTWRIEEFDGVYYLWVKRNCYGDIIEKEWRNG